MTKKVLAHDIVNVRAARSDKDYVPLLVSIPRTIVEAINIKKDDKLHMYTDGERIYLDKIKEPEL